MAVHFRLKPYILVFLVVTSTVSIIQAARTSGAVLSYEFLHKECTKGSLSGTNGAILGNFVGVQQSPDCPPSNGLTGKTSFVVSTLNVSKIATLLDQDFTLELWLRPSIRMNEGDTILAIADQNGGISSKGCNFDMKVIFGC